MPVKSLKRAIEAKKFDFENIHRKSIIRFVMLSYQRMSIKYINSELKDLLLTQYSIFTHLISMYTKIAYFIPD